MNPGGWQNIGLNSFQKIQPNSEGGFMNQQTPNLNEQQLGSSSTHWLYILSNSKPGGPLYLGNTTCLTTRMHDHLNGSRRDYAHYHRLTHLVYFESWEDEDKFKARLRRVRNWPRDMRLLLIESGNPHWHDLWPQYQQDILQSNIQEREQLRVQVA